MKAKCLNAFEFGGGIDALREMLLQNKIGTLWWSDEKSLTLSLESEAELKKKIISVADKKTRVLLEKRKKELQAKHCEYLFDEWLKRYHPRSLDLLFVSQV